MKCKTCGGEVKWMPNRKLPSNPNGTDHLTVCKMTVNARIMAYGEPYEESYETGYIYEDEKVPFHQWTEPIKGSQYGAAVEAK